MIKRISLGLILSLVVGCSPFTNSEQEPNKNNNKSNNNSEQKNNDKEDTRHIAERPSRGDGALNIAVAPGGGLNTYASLVLAKLFAEAAGKDLKDSFNIFWGLSGGSLAATLLMDENAQSALDDFKAEVRVAFPDVYGIAMQALNNIDKIPSITSDSDGSRRKAFSESLASKIQRKYFGKDNKFVLVASAGGKPVCYADGGISLPAQCVHRVGEGSSIVDGVINSSNYQVSKEEALSYMPAMAKFLAGPLLPEFSSLFKKQKVQLFPANKSLEVIDGFFAGNTYLDGNSPLPLALEYALQFKTANNAEHTIVVFDNGSASINEFSNSAFRTKIGMNDEGYARVEKNGVAVTIYLIKLKVEKEQYLHWMMDRSKDHWEDTEALVKAEINGPRRNIFSRAVDAIRNSFIN